MLYSPMRFAAVTLLISSAVLIVTTPVTHADDKPQPNAPAWHLSQPIIKDLPAKPAAITGSTVTTLGTLMDGIGELLVPLVKAKEAGKLNPTGPLVFIYKGVTGDPDEEFKLTILQPVADKDIALEGFENKPVPEFHCVSFFFTGRYQDLPQGYAKAMPQVFAAGHVPTGESREVYLYHESDTSANNITEIQIGIEKKDDDAQPEI